uniref:Orotate phosphoribosyltransferase n=1 Tax=Staphylothermus marinus TaxID=2280 RepID=A0A7C4DAZ2_STAMA
MIYEDLVKEMIQSKIITFGEYRLSSGRISPFYINLRILPSNPDLMNKIMSRIVEYIEMSEIDFDTIAGIETSGIVYATYLSCLMKKPLAYIRKKKKEHGLKNLIEGLIEDRRVLLIDDVSTTGLTLYNAIKVIRENKGIVENALVIIDRLEGAREKLRELNVELKSLLDMKTIVKILVKNNLITDREYSRIINYYREQGFRKILNDDQDE